MIEQINNFQLDGEPVFSTPFGSGHINHTYLIIDSTARQYILQKINKNVFKNPEKVMQNIIAVTNHLRQTAESFRHVLTLIPAKDGTLWYIDPDGEYWRLYAFISDSVFYDKAMKEHFAKAL